MSIDPVAALRAANPLPTDAARGLELPDADLLEAITAELRAPSRPGATAARRRRRRLAGRLALAGGLASLAVAGIAALPAGKETGGSGGGGPQIVWAAELVRFAEASPLVLLDAPDWRIEYVDEQSAREGEIHFLRGSAPAPPQSSLSVTEGEPIPPAFIAYLRRQAELHWRSGSLSGWMEDRANSAAVTTTAPVLGTTAHVYEYGRAGAFAKLPNYHDITALWTYRGYVMEFRWAAPDMATFKARLADLRRVDTNAWLSAMPASVVKTADRPSAVAEMLEGIPLPPGFDAAKIPGARLTKDRYQLGAQVTGAVACAWIKRWSEARRRGDTTTVNAAIAAMATAKDWPILHEMAKEGAYPEVLRAYAAAMRTGTWYGRPLEGDVEGGLGCSERGVRLTSGGDTTARAPKPR